MSKRLDMHPDFQAKEDLESLRGFLNIVEIQISVLSDNLPSEGHSDREAIEEVGKELQAIARSIRIASTMVGTAQLDYDCLLDRAHPPSQPLRSTGTG